MVAANVGHVNAKLLITVMPRFAILTHDHPYPHWDLLLEVGESLRTWRLEAAPEVGSRAGATAMPDHRLIYLDYEGPVSGGRGTVARWDAGTYRAERWEPDGIEVTLQGTRYCGRVGLALIDGAEWRMECGR